MTENKIVMNGKPLTPRELTVRECETLLENLPVEVHPLEALCPDEPIPATAIASSCNLEMAELDEHWKDLTSSQIKELFAQVRVKNPFLARAVESLAEVGARILAEESKTSAAPAAD